MRQDVGQLTEPNLGGSTTAARVLREADGGLCFGRHVETVSPAVARTTCPCGSALNAAACCARYHDGELAPTALALMRSRYTAYVRADLDYLIRTHDVSTRGSIDHRALSKFAKTTLWMGLEIVATEAGGERDDAGIVEFIARGMSGGKPFAQRERSRFARCAITGAWFYVDAI